MKRYKVKCREKTFIGAVLNGHAVLWPECEAQKCESGYIEFYKKGKLVWSCNPEYFEVNFDHEVVGE